MSDATPPTPRRAMLIADDNPVSRPRILVDTSLEEMMLLQGGGHGETEAR